MLQTVLTALSFIDEPYETKYIRKLTKQNLKIKYTVAVTGSIGKTTVKDFIYSLLSHTMNVHKSENNFNNILGLSYTLLSARKERTKKR